MLEIDKVGGLEIVSQINYFGLSVNLSIGQACAVTVAKHLRSLTQNAKASINAYNTVKISTILSFLAPTISLAIVMPLRKQLISIFANPYVGVNGQITDTANYAFIVTGVTQYASALRHIYTGALGGMRDFWFSTICNLVSLVGINGIMGYIFGVECQLGIPALLLVQEVSALLAATPPILRWFLKINKMTFFSKKPEKKESPKKESPKKEKNLGIMFAQNRNLLLNKTSSKDDSPKLASKQRKRCGIM